MLIVLWDYSKILIGMLKLEVNVGDRLVRIVF